MMYHDLAKRNPLPLREPALYVSDGVANEAVKS